MGERAGTARRGIAWIWMALAAASCGAFLGRDVIIPGDLAGDGETRTARMVTLLPRDAIPAILEPRFVTGEDAEAQMHLSERVLAVSIAGDSRAYPVNVLSAVEIVNDTVGGVHLAVTY